MTHTEKISAIEKLIKEVNFKRLSISRDINIEPNLFSLYAHDDNLVEVYCETRPIISYLDEFFYLSKVLDCTLWVTTCNFIDRPDLPCLTFIL